MKRKKGTSPVTNLALENIAHSNISEKFTQIITIKHKTENKK